MNGTNSTFRVARTGVLLLAVWLAFFNLQTAMSRALPGPQTMTVAGMLKTDLAIAALWALLSLGIAAWHRRVRTFAPTILALIALHVPTLLVAAFLDSLVTRIALTTLAGSPVTVPFAVTAVFYADFDIVSYVAVVVVAEALLVRGALLQRHRLAKRLETSLSRARLDYLEAQLQPHFLFNSLGAVSELAYDTPAAASRVLRQLAAIFRTALARKADEVTLGEEIIGIEPYLDIQRIRFADWLTIDYHVDDGAVDCLLPRFVLQPLVENAIRHGLSGRSAAGTINISATVEQGSLLVRVADNGVGLEAVSSSSGRGIGLANVRDRLAILYGDDDRLRLSGNATGGTLAELRVPVRRRVDGGEAFPEAERSGVVPIRETYLRALHAPALLRQPIVAISVIWLACAALWSTQSALYHGMRHHLANMSLLDVVGSDVTRALTWALITPPLMALSRRYPIRRDNIAWRAPAYFLAGAATTFLHVALVQRLTSPEVALWSPAWEMTFTVDFVIYWMLVAIGHRRVLTEWLRAREASAAVLSAELAAAQARAAKLQGIPTVLLHSLEGIADTARRDPALTERQLTRLADYLRLALEATDERGMTPERERALESAVAALRDSGAYSLDLTLTA